MRIRGRIHAGRTLFLTFSVFKASLIVEGCHWQRVSIAFPASKGDGCMKDTDHPIRHPRVHFGDRASAQRSESYARLNAQDGRGMAACWAIGMAHQFLLHLERSPSLVDKTPESVAECVRRGSLRMS